MIEIMDMKPHLHWVLISKYSMLVYKNRAYDYFKAAGGVDFIHPLNPDRYMNIPEYFLRGL